MGDSRRSIYEYVLVEDISTGLLFRMYPFAPIPDGFREVTRDRYGRPVYGMDGRLDPRYGMVERLGYTRWGSVDA
jgi:hypothetical protein